MRVLLYTAGDNQSHHEVGKALKALPPGEYVVDVKKHKHQRSVTANKYYWAILTIIANQSGEYDRDSLHEICKKKFNGKMLSLPKGGAELVGQSTSELDSKEFARYVSIVKMWARDEFSVIVPEPQDMTYQRWSEIENSYANTFHE